MNRWTTSNKAIYNINYHLIWCPKYRRKILIGDIEKRLKDLLLEKASKLNIIIEQLEIMPDHVHLFVKSIPIYPPQFIVGQLKGYTSKILRNEFPKLKSRLPCLWSRSYYCESFGNISEDVIKKYIKDQKGV